METDRFDWSRSKFTISWLTRLHRFRVDWSYQRFWVCVGWHRQQKRDSLFWDQRWWMVFGRFAALSSTISSSIKKLNRIGDRDEHWSKPLRFSLAALVRPRMMRVLTFASKRSMSRFNKLQGILNRWCNLLQTTLQSTRSLAVWRSRLTLISLGFASMFS